MSAGERVTWETCPRCGLSAAVGWRDGALVAVDCPGGCRLAAVDFGRRGANGFRSRDTTVTYRQLQDAQLSRCGTADGDGVPVGRQDSDVFSDRG